MTRSRDEFDEDDYDGYRRPQSGGAGRARVVATAVAAAIVLVMITAVLVLFVRRGQRAEVAIEQVRAEATRVETARNAPPLRPLPTAHAWPRMIGTWSRTPADQEEGGYPFYLEFHKDHTGAIKHTGSGGMPIQHEVKVEVVADQGNTARLALITKDGRYVYTLTVNPGGTLTLDDRKGGLVFHRGQ